MDSEFKKELERVNKIITDTQDLTTHCDCECPNLKFPDKIKTLLEARNFTVWKHDNTLEVSWYND